MRIPSLLLVIGLALCGTACGDGRGTGGLQFGEDGATFDTAEAARRKAERVIAKAVSDEVGVAWRCGAAIAEEPEWNAGDERWEWRAATATVTLAGSQGPLDEPELRRAVASYLAKHQRAGAPAPVVTVAVVGPEARAAAAPTTASAAGWRYTIQAGDTLAQISSVFYGSPDGWRRILDANPGLHAEALPVGSAIVIPPASP